MINTESNQWTMYPNTNMLIVAPDTLHVKEGRLTVNVVSSLSGHCISGFSGCFGRGEGAILNSCIPDPSKVPFPRLIESRRTFP